MDGWITFERIKTDYFGIPPVHISGPRDMPQGWKMASKKN